MKRQVTEKEFLTLAVDFLDRMAGEGIFYHDEVSGEMIHPDVLLLNFVESLPEGEFPEYFSERVRSDWS